MSTIFVSHSSRDNAAAVELKRRLEVQGHRSVFLDLDPEKGMQAGVSWERTLYTKLRACRAVVALCSDPYLASQWCFAEIALARMEGKQVFVLLGEAWSGQTPLPSILTEEQFIDLRTDPEDAYKRLWDGFRVKGITPQEHRQWGPEDPPYPGLRAFEARDAPIFFGRDAEVREGIELLNRARRQGFPRLAMVLGASGSGKSSLTRAGLVPQLCRDRNQWRVVAPFRPGPRPLRELSAALAEQFEDAGEPGDWESIYAELDGWGAKDANSHDGVAPASQDPTETTARDSLVLAMETLEAELEAELSESDSTVLDSLRHLRTFLTGRSVEHTTARVGSRSGNPLVEIASRLRLSGGPSQASVVLVIDQFEELLGYEQQQNHPANRFLALLRDALECEGTPLLALGTMRSDYLGVFQRAPTLIGIGFKSLSLGPMTREGMRQIIERPAQLGQIQLEDGLTERLLHDTGTSDALPLLAFTLQVMWERYRKDRLLEIREYEDLGGLQGAIAQVADETLEGALALGAEADLREAFLRLARPTEEGTGWARQPLDFERLGDEVRPMVQHFVDQRLLVRREDGSVEVAHEALFRSWAQLRAWLNENAEGLHLLRDVRSDAAKWQQAAADADKDAYIWRGGRLARALELRSDGVLVLEDLDRAFIDASEGAARAGAEAEAARQRRERETLEKLAREQTQRAEEQTRAAARLRRRLLVATAVGLVAIAASIIALVQMVNATRQSAIAQAVSAASLLDSRPMDALRHAIEAAGTSRRLGFARLQPPPEVGNGLFAALQVARAGRMELNALEGHTDWVGAVAFSADGQMIVTGGDDGTVRRWSADGEALEPAFQGHEASVNAVAVHPDGTLILSGGNDGTLRLSDRDGQAAGSPITAGDDMEINAVAFSPDGTLIASGGTDAMLRVWRLDGSLSLESAGHGDAVSAIAFSPDGRFIVTGSDDKTLRLWTRDGEPLTTFTGHTDEIMSVAFSPDGQSIVSAGDDRTVRRWNLDGKPMSAPFRGHTNIITSVAFSPDGRMVMSASEDRSVRLWSLQGKPLAPPLLGHDGPVYAVRVLPEGTRIVSTSLDKTVRLWPVPKVMAGHSDEVNGVAMSGDGTTVASASSDGTVRVWQRSADTLAEGPVFDGHDDGVNAVAISQDGQIVASAGFDGSVRVSDPHGRGIDAAPIRHEDEALAVAMTEDGRLIASGGGEGSIYLWNRVESSAVGPFMAHEGGVGAIAFSPDGKTIASAGADNTVRQWDLQGEPSAPPFEGHTDVVRSVAFSPDGRLIVSAGHDKTVQISDRNGRRVGSPLVGHLDVVRSAIFHSGGRVIISVAEDSTLRLWRSDGTPIGRAAREHDDWVASVAASDSAPFVVSGSKDFTLRLWDVHDAEAGVDAWLREACQRFAAHSISDTERGRTARSICESASP